MDPPIPDTISELSGALPAEPLSVGLGGPLVARQRLIRKLEEARTPVVLLNAPSGYGKSVLLYQWAEQSSRPFTWLVLGKEHNDPAMLVASIVEALGRVEAVPTDVTEALFAPEPSIEGIVLPRLFRALAERRLAAVLVLDDLEQIESPESLAVVCAIGTHLKGGSQLALATRTEPALPIGRLRAHHGLTELGRADLAMTKVESDQLLNSLGLKLRPKQLDVMVQRTEGWPAALYLAGLALGEDTDLDRAVRQFAGDDRFVVDYIREVFLVPISKRRLEFLRRVSLLDRFSGELCDYVLERRGSATAIRDLSRSNALLTALDRRDEWFRFHALFREMLRSELHRAEPQEEERLHRRASQWWAEQGDWDRAIHHAIEGEAFDRAGELLWMGVPEYMTRGRNATVLSWLERLGADVVASDSALSLTAAYAHITRGAGSEAEHWAAVSASLVRAEEASEKREALQSGLSLVEAVLARDGVEAMSARTAAAAKSLPEESPWLSLCCLLDGAGMHLRGVRAGAREKLAEGARRGSVAAPSMQVLCLAQLSLLALEEDDRVLAEMLASQARAQIDRSGLVEYPIMALGLAVSALVRSQLGKVREAAADRRLATDLLGRLDAFAPWYEAETMVTLARTAARLDDVTVATGLLEEAARVLKLTPDAVVLGEWIEQTAITIEAVSSAAVGELTPAELRVLQFLPTHLSLPQIAAQAFVSPNTVKTQAQSIYRKLGVSSRREAVERARSSGLLGLERSTP